VWWRVCGCALVKGDYASGWPTTPLSVPHATRFLSPALQVSGIRFEFDAGKQAGSRIVPGSVEVAGTPLDPLRVYKVRRALLPVEPPAATHRSRRLPRQSSVVPPPVPPLHLSTMLACLGCLSHSWLHMIPGASACLCGAGRHQGLPARRQGRL
jgi:hypothetical protein